jgi:DNA-binding PadR family transcriptional regulator
VAPPTITKIVSKLEEDGLVVRTVDSRDRRVARVSVSEGGRARLDHSRSRRDAWLTRRLEEVTPEEIAQVTAALPVLEAMAAGAAQPHREGDAPAQEHPAESEHEPAKEPSSTTVTK